MRFGPMGVGSVGIPLDLHLLLFDLFRRSFFTIYAPRDEGDIYPWKQDIPSNQAYDITHRSNLSLHPFLKNAVPVSLNGIGTKTIF